MPCVPTVADEQFENVSCLFGCEKPLKQLSRKGQFNLPTYVCICTGCGLVFLNPRWKKERYEEFYKQEFSNYEPVDLDSSLKENLDDAPEAIQVWNRLKIFNIGSTQCILDMGCGAGSILKTLKARIPNSSLFAIEPQQAYQEYLKKKLSIEVVATDVDSKWYELYPNKFDLIIMRHVLEHFLNPIESLKKTVSTLSPNGLLYLAVPNMMNPGGSLRRYWFRAAHTFYFSETTLLQILSRAGLEQIAIQSEGRELWGVFKKGSEPLPLRSVYIEQMEAVRKAKIRYCLECFLSSLRFPIRLFNYMKCKVAKA